MRMPTAWRCDVRYWSTLRNRTISTMIVVAVVAWSYILIRTIITWTRILVRAVVVRAHILVRTIVTWTRILVRAVVVRANILVRTIVAWTIVAYCSLVLVFVTIVIRVIYLRVVA